MVAHQQASRACIETLYKSRPPSCSLPRVASLSAALLPACA
jgi:hypothetical protein